MHTETITQHCEALNKEMHLCVYGHSGVPILGFPTQNATCRCYEDFGLVEHLRDYLTDGRVQLFVVDTVDSESWTATHGDPAWRARRQEQYYRYIVDEVVPLINARNPGALPLVMGMSLGANHAAITFLRRPDLFGGVLALSGVYDSRCYFGDWMDPTLYDNSPELFLPNMPADHDYIGLYNSRKMIFCVGQGAWEDEGVRSLMNLRQIFEEKGILAWCDFWGYDVCHDWPWWFKQVRYFLPHLLER